jgi:peptide/nickel transport system permease protein
MALRRYLLKRAIISVILFFTVLVFNFFLFRLPVFILGIDPAYLYINPGMRPDVAEHLRILYGLPPAHATLYDWWIHFLRYLGAMITGEFGTSFQSFRPVSMDILERLPNTLLLMGSSMILETLIGVVLGIVAASRHGGKLDTGVVSVSLSLYSVPVFWLGMILLLFFSFYIPIFPMGHSISFPVPTNPILYILDLMWHLALPCATLTLAFFGGYVLLMRNTLVEVLTEDYMLTARAKGLDERTVLFKHGVRNAFLPVLTMIAMNFAFIIGGATLTETVFAWYGMGRLLFESLIFQDWPVAQAIFWLLAAAVIIANVIADVLYGVLDPRIKYG